MRRCRAAQRHRLLLLPRRRVPQSQGEGNETGREPLLAAEELLVRIGDHGDRLPLRGPARRHHRGRDHHLRQAQGLHRQRPRHLHHPPSPLLDEFCPGRYPAGDRVEHEQRAALRQGVVGRGLLRRQEWRLRRRRRAGRRHGAAHSRLHVRNKVDDGGGGGGGGVLHHGSVPGKRRRRTTSLPIQFQAMTPRNARIFETKQV